MISEYPLDDLAKDEVVTLTLQSGKRVHGLFLGLRKIGNRYYIVIDRVDGRKRVATSAIRYIRSFERTWEPEA